MRNADGNMQGVEVVIDKDRTSALLALGLDADALLLLTDVAAVYQNFGGPDQRVIEGTTLEALEKLDLPPWSKRPKAVAEFGTASGKRAGIGQLTDACSIIEGRAETLVLPNEGKTRQRATDNTRAPRPIVSDV